MPFNLTSPIPEKGIAVPIYATYTSHVQMPFWWAISTNSASPKLRLFEDELELKVIKTHKRLLSDIVLADAYCGAAKTNNVILTWNDTPWTFTANVIRRDWLMRVLELLTRKQVPLSPRAMRLLNEI